MKQHRENCAILILLTLLIVDIWSVAMADTPDPRPGATTPVREQNVDENGWIAVHEQGVADVKVTEGQIDANITGGSVDANITGGSIEAEITGGEVEVTNDVTVKLAEDEIVPVEIVADSTGTPFTTGICIGSSYYSGWDVVDYRQITSIVCEATSSNGSIHDAFFVSVYERFNPVSSYSTLLNDYPEDVCAPFTEAISDGALDPTYRYFCKSNTKWTTISPNYLPDGEYYKLYFVQGGNLLAPIDHLCCRVHGYRIE